MPFYDRILYVEFHATILPYLKKYWFLLLAVSGAIYLIGIDISAGYGVIQSIFFFAIMTILWVAVIFLFSLQPGEVSGDISGSFLRKVLEWFAPGVFEKLETMPQEQLDIWHMILRKCAHFTEFAVLGVLSSLTLLQTKVSHRVLIALMFCLAVASMDETLQLFVDGRAGRIVDVMIDGAGALSGIGVVGCLLGWRKIRKKHE